MNASIEARSSAQPSWGGIAPAPCARRYDAGKSTFAPTASSFNLESTNLIARTEDKTLEVCAWAETRYGRLFEVPELRFDLRGLTAGLAYPARNLIRFNLNLLKANPQDFISETVPHEVAHLLSWTINGPEAKPHGPEWKAIMNDMGLNPEVCHTYPATRARARGRIQKVFFYACACAGRRYTFTAIQHKRSAAGVNYRCTNCKAPVRYIGPGVQLLF